MLLIIFCIEHQIEIAQVWESFPVFMPDLGTDLFFLFCLTSLVTSSDMLHSAPEALHVGMGFSLLGIFGSAAVDQSLYILFG